MLSKTLTTLLTTSLTLLTTTFATPITYPTLTTRDTAEIYYLTNCFNQSNPSLQWAEIDYYADSSLSNSGQTPDEIGILNPTESIDYEDGTWFVTSPFTFTAFIGDDASTAPAGSVVGDANSSTFAGEMECVRLVRVVLYEPVGVVECFSDYACVDVSCIRVLEISG